MSGLAVGPWLAAKRDGRALDGAALQALMRGCADGRVDDAQLGAFAMAVALRGMQPDECAELTRAMRDSGRRLDWCRGELHGPLVDKHSTGGVGDLVSLVLAPALAACGAHVPMLSGRALGHSGGTLDKLESIPGYDVYPDNTRFQRIVGSVGCAIIGATADLAPADRRLYAIRDRTATVAVLPLIVASILSKKLAVGLDALVLDVKCGNGALLPDRRQAQQLADLLARTADALGQRCAVLQSDMDQPLAPCAGNAIEVREALACLRGERRHGRALTLALALGARLLHEANLYDSVAVAHRHLQASIDDGRAAERFAAMVHALGGPADLLEHVDHHLPRAAVVQPLLADAGGRVAAIDVATLGRAVIALGGGRDSAAAAIDPAVGLSDIVELGATIEPGQPLLTIHAADHAGWQRAAAMLGTAIRLADPGMPGGPDLARCHVPVQSDPPTPRAIR